MVTTRRQWKSIEPPALVPVAAPKRKRIDNAAPAPPSSTAQPLAQSSSKRRKKRKGFAKTDTSAVPTSSAPAEPAAKKAKLSRRTRLEDEHWARKRERAQQEESVTSKTDDTRLNSSKRLAHVDLTNDSDPIEDEAARCSQPAAPWVADDEDVDSRYALSSRRKAKMKKPRALAAQRTAELDFEEDGLEEIDKAEAAVANAGNRTFSQVKKRDCLAWTSHSDPDVSRRSEAHPSQVNGTGESKVKKNITPPMAVPSKVVMFTVTEAIAALSFYQGGTMSVPAVVDPQSRQPYEPVQTGEYLSYPVKGTYNLGSVGRYGIDTVPPPPFSLVMLLSEHSFVQLAQDAPSTEPLRHGLGFDGFLAARPKVSSVRRPNNYCFTFGKYKGRRMDSVPIEYLRSLHNSDEYHNDSKLQQAFEDLYPKGLYESEVESYTLEKGGFKGKRLDEVPKIYVWGLLRNAKESGLLKKGKGRLERALEVWEKGQLDLTQD